MVIKKKTSNNTGNALDNINKRFAQATIKFDGADPKDFEVKYNPDTGLYTNKVQTASFRNAVDANRWNTDIVGDNSRVIVDNGKITTENRSRAKIQDQEKPFVNNLRHKNKMTTWELMKATGTGRERAEYKRMERADKARQLREQQQELRKQKPLPTSLTIDGDTTNTQNSKANSQVSIPSNIPEKSLEEIIKEKADQRLEKEQKAYDKEYGTKGIVKLLRPL